MISASDIRERKFEKAAFGYKQEDIDDFLDELIRELEEKTFTARYRYLQTRSENTVRMKML